MKRVLTATAFWINNHWKIAVQKEGIRRQFYDSTPGKRGKALCEAKAREWLESRSLTDPRFSEAWDEFMTQRKKDVSTTYYEETNSFGITWLLPALGKKKLSSITPMDFQRIVDAMADAGRAKKTVRDFLGVVSAFSKYCRKNRYEFEQPEDLTIRGAEKKQKRVLSTSDMNTVFTADTTTDHGRIIPEHYIHAFRFCIVTGERRGEVAGLRWDDIADGRIHLQRSINRLQEETPGKTENAQRTIPVSRLVSQILEDQKAYLRKAGVISPWVFPEEDGAMTKPDHMYRHWKHFCDVHDIPAITFHEIRHTAISLYKADMPEELTKRLVGHSESMDTFGVYGHEVDGDLERTAGIMDKVLGQYLKSVS
jgi:integrase